MDFRQIQYVCTVAEHQSITRAAEILYISQPSLSHFISKAEDELSVKLFDRSTTPISLTFAGERYVEDGKKILRINEEMRKHFRDISQNMTGRLRVGMPRERAAYMLPIILPEYKKLFPGIEIKLSTASGKALFDALYKGQIDFMILPNHVIEKGIKVYSIYTEELVLIASKGFVKDYHLLNGKNDTVDLEKLTNENFITLHKGHAIRTSFDLLFKYYSVSPPIQMETNSNITSMRMAAAGLGLTIVPRMTIELAKCTNEFDVYSLATPPVTPITWEVVAIYRSDAYIGIAEQAFLETSRRLFSKSK